MREVFSMLDDSEIIDLFFMRSERAITELSAKYGPLCMKISMNILSQKQDAEECVNDSYLVAWNTIPPQKPNPLRSYICRIVRNQSINRWRYKNAKKRKSEYDLCLEELENVLSASGKIDDELNEKTLVSYLEEFLDTLDPVNRMIFIRRFWFMDSYQAIAKRSGLREVTIRVRISRTKRSLKTFLVKKGVII